MIENKHATPAGHQKKIAEKKPYGIQIKQSSNKGGNKIRGHRIHLILIKWVMITKTNRIKYSNRKQ